MPSYDYDADNQFFPFVVLTFLLLVLLPATYRAFNPRQGKAPDPFPIQLKDPAAEKVVQDRPASSVNKGSVTRFVVLAVGWAMVFYVGYTIVTQKRQASVLWNPYEILGVSESATEKEIKKHYKRLSIKFHPDKIRLAANETLDQAQEQFVGLTKAYKALTDEEIRHNYLEYGNPDGKQDLAFGMALPVWMVEGGYSLWVLAAYCAVLLVGLPVLVGRWWYRSSAQTKDNLSTGTAETFFRGIEEDMSTEACLKLLALSDEVASVRITEDEFKALEAKVVAVGGSVSNGPERDVLLLLKAHLLRVPVTAKLAVLQTFVLDHIPVLHRGLLSICLAYGYLETVHKVMALSSSITQAISEHQSPLLELPYLTSEHVRNLHAKVGSITSLAQFLELDNAQRKAALDLPQKQYNELVKLAKALPDIEICDAHFEVEGDSSISPSAIVQFVFKVRRAGGKALKLSDLEEPKVEEGDVEALLQADKQMAATAVPDTLSWAPYFPAPAKNSFWLYIADHKQDRVIVGPTNIDDIGEKIRTFKLQFQAPPSVGLYTFQCHVVSDTYKGLDKVCHLELDVVEEPVQAREKEDDEISEADEATIAGQMAAMRGGVTQQSLQDLDSSSDEDDSDDSDSDSSSSDDSD